MKIRNLQYVAYYELSRNPMRDIKLETPKFFPHEIYESGNVSKSLSDYKVGVRWEDEIGNIHDLSDGLSSIFCWPSPNLKYLVAIFKVNEMVYKSGLFTNFYKEEDFLKYYDSVKVFNADGSLRSIIPPPVLDLQLYKKKWYRKKKIMLGYAYAASKAYNTDSNENLVNISFQSYDGRVSESKWLNAETGQYVKTVTSYELTSEIRR